MSTQISLDHLPASQRFECFREMANKLYVPVSLACDDPKSFYFARTQKTFGSLSFNLGKVTKLAISRTPRDVMLSESNAKMKMKLTLPLSGSVGVRQDKRETLIRPGQFYFTDPVRPYEEVILEDSTYISIYLPKGIQSRLSSSDLVTAREFGTDLPHSKLTRDFLANLLSVWNTIGEDSAAHLGSIALDLIMAALLERSNPSDTQDDVYRSRLFHRAKALIDGSLHDPELSLSQIATAMGISTRYVRYLLHEQGLSYRCYVLEQRLLRAAHDLGDSRLGHRAVTAIAYAWGFSDSAHFSRSFKAARGMSPRDYRAFKMSTAPIL